MEDNLRKLVKENTIHEKYKLNNASQLGTQLGLSRNWISQYLNEYYNDGTFIKINTRPVVFLDREALEEKYSIRVDKNLLTSFDELRSIIQGQNTSDFEKLIGQKGSLRDVVDKCKASLSAARTSDTAVWTNRNRKKQHCGNDVRIWYQS